jgi:hypothetical protein
LKARVAMGVSSDPVAAMKRLRIALVLAGIVAVATLGLRDRTQRRPFAGRGLGYIPSSQRIEGAFFRSQGFTAYPTGRKPEEIAVADFNDDGLLDVAACSSYQRIKPPGGDVSVYLGVGGGRLGKETRIVLGELTEGIAAAHFDDDRFLDLATADYGGGTLSILRGSSQGPVQRIQTLRLGSAGPRDVVARDVDRDGRIDLVFCAMDADQVGVARGQGDGTFVLSGTRVDVGDGPEVLALGRFNRDLAEDLVTANRHGNSVTVLHGDGAGGFRVAQELPAGQLPRYVLVADLDGDGFDDFLSASHKDARVTPFRNLQGGGFQALEPLAVAGLQGAIYLAVGDVDGDGLVDLAASLHRSGYVVIFAGRGGFSFAEPQLVPIGVSCLGVAIADLSGDGSMDLVVGNPLANRLQVYIQER